MSWQSRIIGKRIEVSHDSRPFKADIRLYGGENQFTLRFLEGTSLQVDLNEKYNGLLRCKDNDEPDAFSFSWRFLNEKDASLVFPLEDTLKPATTPTPTTTTTNTRKRTTTDSSAVATSAKRSGKKTKLSSPPPDEDVESEWSRSLVGKSIDVPYETKFHQAIVKKDLGDNLFEVSYVAEPSKEKLKLFPNFSGSDPKGEDKFEWRMTPPTSISTATTLRKSTKV